MDGRGMSGMSKKPQIQGARLPSTPKPIARKRPLVPHAPIGRTGLAGPPIQAPKAPVPASAVTFVKGSSPLASAFSAPKKVSQEKLGKRKLSSPNNPDLYNAAVLGFAAGAFLGKDMTAAPAVEGTYTAISAQAATFAAEMDAAIPAGSPTSAQSVFLGALIQSVYANKYSTGLASSDFETMTANLAAFYAEIAGQFVAGSGPGTINWFHGNITVDASAGGLVPCDGISIQDFPCFFEITGSPDAPFVLQFPALDGSAPTGGSYTIFVHNNTEQPCQVCVSPAENGFPLQPGASRIFGWNFEALGQPTYSGAGTVAEDVANPPNVSVQIPEVGDLPGITPTNPANVGQMSFGYDYGPNDFGSLFGDYASQWGGLGGNVDGAYSATVGGLNGSTQGPYAVVVGGVAGVASGNGSVVLGGSTAQAPALNSIASGNTSLASVPYMRAVAAGSPTSTIGSNQYGDGMVYCGITAGQGPSESVALLLADGSSLPFEPFQGQAGGATFKLTVEANDGSDDQNWACWDFLIKAHAFNGAAGLSFDGIVQYGQMVQPSGAVPDVTAVPTMAGTGATDLTLVIANSGAGDFALHLGFVGGSTVAPWNVTAHWSMVMANPANT
jgi:hypothetical protein